MVPSFIQKSQIPHKPGIYQYKNADGKIIYVGKAVDLFNRVSSYFSGSPHDLKTMQLVSNIASVETIIVESELEALILEANLIKKYLPLYNIRLTDDKDYLYIAVTKEDYPRIITARKQELNKDILKYFGPFPSSRTVKETLKKLRRIFPWCNAKKQKARSKQSLRSADLEKQEVGVESTYEVIGSTPRRSNGRACFYYHLGLCPGACINAISKEDYRKNINLFIKFMDGGKQALLDDLTEQMTQLSKLQQFEEAAKLKKIYDGINYLTQPNRIASYLENPNFLEDLNNQSLRELQKVLNLEKLPVRIECYDISNISGTNATGSMVVLTNGEIDKSQYRKFKIKISGKPDDYAMHQEMMERRLKHKEWEYPQVFIIDGGRGQVRASFEQLQKANVNIPIYGIAKRFEWLYPPDGEVIKLPKKSLALRLLQKIRDESHRFAITYHRKLRKKAAGF